MTQKRSCHPLHTQLHPLLAYTPVDRTVQFTSCFILVAFSSTINNLASQNFLVPCLYMPQLIAPDVVRARDVRAEQQSNENVRGDTPQAIHVNTPIAQTYCERK
jgi:hypothetical protein